MVRFHAWSWLADVAAALLIVLLAATPFFLNNTAIPAWERSAQKTSPIPLAVPYALQPPALSPAATPVDPRRAPAKVPTVDQVRSAALVAGEDFRLRQLLHHIGRLTYPALIPAPTLIDATSGVLRNSTPTLVLPGPASYTISDLQALGAALPLTQGGYILVDGVLVGPGATLTIKAPDVPMLLLASSGGGFTSIVVWGGTLSLQGDSPDTPMSITGWNRDTNQIAADTGDGRPYLRAVGGRMELRNVRVSSLGFWSGRTGGVAWTGISSKPSTGGAVSSVFAGNAYGVFAARATGLQFRDDLFEANELDGIRLHRNAINSSVVSSASVRNGGNGFVVSRGATGDTLEGDLALNNAENGFLLNGLPLVSGASPSGDRAVASIGTVVENSDAESNGRTGILVEGGAGTIVRQNIVCGPVTGIAVHAGATDTMVVGNEVRCGGRVALAIGPSVTGTTVDGNTLGNARIGLLIRNSQGVRIIKNRFIGISVFAISIRGASPGVVGNDNYVSGRGFQPLDVRGGAPTPTILNSNVSAWQHRTSLSWVAELRYHPILDAWLVILALIVLLTLATRFRKRPARPYHYTVPWRPTTTAAATDGQAHPSVIANTSVIAAPTEERATA